MERIGGDQGAVHGGAILSKDSNGLEDGVRTQHAENPIFPRPLTQNRRERPVITWQTRDARRSAAIASVWSPT